MESGSWADWVSGIATVVAIIVVFWQVISDRKHAQNSEEMKKAIEKEEQNLDIVISVTLEMYKKFDSISEISNYPKEGEKVNFEFKSNSYRMAANIYLTKKICEFQNIEYLDQSASFDSAINKYIKIMSEPSVTNKNFLFSEAIKDTDTCRTGIIKNIENMTRKQRKTS